jgi:hypothetical protein
MWGKQPISLKRQRPSLLVRVWREVMGDDHDPLWVEGENPLRSRGARTDTWEDIWQGEHSTHARASKASKK